MAAVDADVRLEAGLKDAGLLDAAADGTPPPTIDLSGPAEEVEAALWAAANEVGFFTVTGHGIPQETIDACFAASEAFFSQGREAKEEQSPFARQLNSGYEYMSQVRPSSGTPDQKESLQVTAREAAMDGRWPREPADSEPVAKGLLTAAHGLACRLLTLLEKRACPHLTPGTLAAAHKLWAHDGQCTLRLLHYPPVAEGTDPGLWRAAPHTDWDCVTLLFQRPGHEGLECAANPRQPEHAGWARVDPVEGGIAINVGDMLSRWSAGRLLSNLHRVRMPATAEERGRPRYSIAFFAQADKAQLIEAEGSEPITAGDYILGRIKSNFAAKAA